MRMKTKAGSRLVRVTGVWVSLFLSMWVRSAAEPPRLPQQQPELDSLAWLSGHWISPDDSLSEELWLTPLGGNMLGLSRQQTGSGGVFFEYLRIEATAEGTFYVASPRGRSETRFLLKKVEARRVVFENLLHDFPKRITYWLDKDGRLHSRIEGDSPDGPSREWIWHKKGEPLRR